MVYLVLQPEAGLTHDNEQFTELREVVIVCAFSIVNMYVCIRKFIMLLQLKQSQVHVHRPNRRDVSSSCYRKVQV